MNVYTDYPFPDFGDKNDVNRKDTPIRMVNIESFDGRGCNVDYGGHKRWIPRKRVYVERGREGEVPTISSSALKRYRK